MLYYTTFEVLTAGEHVLHGHGRRCWDVLAILLFIDISSTIWKKDLITRHVYMYMYILGIRQGRDETNHIDVAGEEITFITFPGAHHQFPGGAIMMSRPVEPNKIIQCADNHISGGSLEYFCLYRCI